MLASAASTNAITCVEEVFGYDPRAVQEQRRVAKELGELTALEAELEGDCVRADAHVSSFVSLASARTRCG